MKASAQRIAVIIPAMVRTMARLLVTMEVRVVFILRAVYDVNNGAETAHGHWK